MRIIRKLLLLVSISFMLTSCNTVTPTHISNSLSHTTVNSKEVSSPFAQFENLKRKGEVGFKREQVDNILRSYGIYDKVMTKIIPKEDYINSISFNVEINGFNIGDKKVSILLIKNGHMYIYIMFSNSSNKWVVNGCAYQNERDKPDYRIERSSDETKYWLVVKHEANRGTGLQMYDEIWYNPDGSVAGEYPIKGSTLFFPQIVEPEANAYFSASADYDGDSKIHLSYSMSFEYGYKENSQDFSSYRIFSKYSSTLRENWEYDLKTQQLKFISCNPALPQGFSTIKHKASADYGILQGYIDFYRMRLGDKTIATLGGWEKFVGLR